MRISVGYSPVGWCNLSLMYLLHVHTLACVHTHLSNL